MRTLPQLLGFVAGAALDATLPDPPNALHPVAAIGPSARFIERFAPHEPEARRRFGWLLAVFAPLLVALLVKRAQSATNPRARIVADAGLLALASSRHTLFSRVAEVADALERSQLDEARQVLGYHLVSRDTASLDASEVAGAAIESLAENLSDGVIAPLTYHAIGGGPLAWAYRTSNTLDALWGYRNERYIDLGRGGARIDDAWNLLPARLTAAAICCAAVTTGDGAAAIRGWQRDRAVTSSPNAGHPMSAIAGALGVELGKRDEYLLGSGARAPDVDDVRTALRLSRLAATLVTGLLALALLFRGRAQ